MAIVIPALRGQMGNTEFFEAKMPARELVTGVRPANELDEWASMGIEDRMQREPNLKRILNEIAPYIARSPDRFFGAVIVLVYKGEITFESIKELGTKLPSAYRSVAEDIGFITIDGGSLIVLDGQHRLLALEHVIKNQVYGSESEAVPNDDVSVIFIQHESKEKTRRIFNRVNRYAKPTSRADNLITSEDDGYAIVTRHLLDEGGPFGVTYLRDNKRESIVNWKSNTLAGRSTQLTTISALYEATKLILADADIPKLDERERPADHELEHYKEIVADYWQTIIDEIPVYQEALADHTRIPALRDDETSATALLFKPAAQVALVKGLIYATDGGRLTLREAAARANQIDWRIGAPLWQNILIRPNHTIDAGQDARERAAQLIAYLIAGDLMEEDEIEEIEEMFNRAHGGEAVELPDPVGAAALA